MNAPRVLRLPSVALVGALAISTVTACSFLLTLRSAQCSTSSDCATFGVGFECVESSCTAPALSDAATDARSDADADASPRCSSNAECIDALFGEPAVCSKSTGSCLALKSADCSVVVPSDELRNDNVVLFGAFLPLQGGAPLSQPVALAYQLALSELKKAGGLPGGTGGPRRPLAAIFCDSDPARAESGVRHLVQTLGVSALITLFSQTDMARFVQDYTVPAGVFALNPQDTTETLKNANVNRLAWHLLGTPEDVALAYRPLLARTETYVHNRLGDSGSPRRLRVALVTSKSPTEEAIEAVVRSDAQGIVVNGDSATVNGTKGHLLRVSIASLETDPKEKFGAVVTQLAVYQPDIVVLLTANESGQIIPPLEDALAANPSPDGGAAVLPVYVQSVRNARVPEVLAYLSTNANEPTSEKRKRFLGVQYAGSVEPTPKADFLLRMKDAYPEVDSATYSATENFYDAIYWMAYGLYAAGPGAPSTGESFKLGVRNLLSGPRISPGSVKTLADGFLALSTAGSATFVGALGPPDIDPAKGTWRSVGGVYCYPPGAGAAVPLYDQLRYNREPKTLTGDFGCFIGPIPF